MTKDLNLLYIAWMSEIYWIGYLYVFKKFIVK